MIVFIVRVRKLWTRCVEEEPTVKWSVMKEENTKDAAIKVYEELEKKPAENVIEQLMHTFSRRNVGEAKVTTYLFPHEYIMEVMEIRA
jgi:hypothetical protein